MMQDVIRRGTGARVVAKGFKEPAAGKTGTARDGWFAGYTSKLLAVVWVGFDDYTDLKLEGGQSALLVWTDFMKRAHKLRPYRDPKPFQAPKGLVTTEIDTSTGLLSTPYCESTRAEYFIAGTEPQESCPLRDHYLLPASQTIVFQEESERKGVLGRVLGIFR
jgi:penicillin-binding protein 1B